MSRSQGAWTEGCWPVTSAGFGAVRRAGHEDRNRLNHPRLLGGAPPRTRLGWAIAFGALMVALVPAAAPAGTPSRPDAQLPTPTITQHAVLAPGSGYGSRNGAHAVGTLQRRLVRAGYALGPIDGRYGPLTERAVMRFQAARGLQVDGIAGPRTEAALNAHPLALYPGAGYAPAGSPQVRTLQHLLERAGFTAGPIDGRYGPLTERAVRRFQAAHRLLVDGIAGTATLSALVRPSHPRPLVRHTSPRRHPHTRAVPRPAQPTNAPTVARHTKHATGAKWIIWVIVLALVGLGLLVTATVYVRRRRGPHHDVPTPDTGGERSTSGPAGRSVSQPAERIASVIEAPLINPVGMFNLGAQLEAEGKRAAAEAAYRNADGRGHPAAATNLGAILEQHGDLAGAKAAYVRAGERGDPNGSFNLGVLLEDQGDLAGAEAAYRDADRCGHSAAATNLGVLLEREHDLAGAEAAYRRAGELGDAIGSFNLGVLLEEQGDLAGAEGAYARAGQRDDTAVTDMARAALLELRDGMQGSTTSGSRGDHHDA